jgi:uncharacterized membrane protein
VNRAFDYMYVFATIAFTVYGQLILKWRIDQLSPVPAEPLQNLKQLLLLFLDPAIFSGFAAAFLASLSWMAAMRKFDLSHAYPFMSLNFVIVMLLSAWLLSESINATKMVGLALIVMGTVIAARG